MKNFTISTVLLVIFVFLTAACSGGTANLDPDMGRDVAGFDDYGNNSNDIMFRGSYFDNYSDAAGYEAWAPYDGDDAAYLANNPSASSHWAWPYREVDLLMKWNADWNAGNTYGWNSTYQDEFEDAWITNHMSGTDLIDGEEYRWSYFVKIVWVGPAPSGDDPYEDTRIWGQFAIIQEVLNDQYSGTHGNQPIPGPNGFGAY